MDISKAYIKDDIKEVNKTMKNFKDHQVDINSKLTTLRTILRITSRTTSMITSKTNNTTASLQNNGALTLS